MTSACVCVFIIVCVCTNEWGVALSLSLFFFSWFPTTGCRDKLAKKAWWQNTWWWRRWVSWISRFSGGECGLGWCRRKTIWLETKTTVLRRIVEPFRILRPASRWPNWSTLCKSIRYSPCICRPVSLWRPPGKDFEFSANGNVIQVNRHSRFPTPANWNTPKLIQRISSYDDWHEPDLNDILNTFASLSFYPSSYTWHLTSIIK